MIAIPLGFKRSQFDIGNSCAIIWPVSSRTRRASQRSELLPACREAALCFDNRKNMNNEPMRLLKPGIEEPEAGATAPGRDGRAPRKVGKGGKEMAKASPFSRLFPPFPGFSHLFPLNFLTTDGHRWTRIPVKQTTETRRRRASGEGSGLAGKSLGRSGIRPNHALGLAKSCGKKCGLLRESPRKSTKVRTDQARKSSIVRIFTGGTIF